MASLLFLSFSSSSLSSFYHLFFTFLAFLLSALIFFLTHKTKSKKLNLPPVNASLYGPVWRSLRRNMVQNMLSSSRLK
ncbi:cytochrome p450 77a1 [Quercus suber]|uniref:Cytochrome p450 77a1 n=1 Tax=Quercus suber TaxID=58331 RepID=A0AAW0JNI3_QUESU